MPSYAEERAQELTRQTREILRDLPEICTDYLLSIQQSTQPLTRFAYAGDLKLFFTYLTREVPRFADKTAYNWSDSDFGSVTPRDVNLYLEYLSYYYKDDDTSVTNSDLSKQRKLSTLRSFYEYLYKFNHIPSNIMPLVDMPKRHEKPILRMEIDEVARMLDQVETGDGLGEHRQAYNRGLRTRDLAILTLFLGTGIRVSELVGMDLEDVDFSLNAFAVTRKGGNRAVLYFSEEVALPLKAYIAQRREIPAAPGSEQALFLSGQKRRIGVRAVEIMVKKYATLASPIKKRLSPHKLRSTFGTNLYHETGDIYLVADVLGHSDVNTTRRHYAAMSDDRRRLAPGFIKLRDDPPEKK